MVISPEWEDSKQIRDKCEGDKRHEEKESRLWVVARMLFYEGGLRGSPRGERSFPTTFLLLSLESIQLMNAGRKILFLSVGIVQIFINRAIVRS